MITKEQIEEELILALEELENSEELTELNPLKSASNWLQRLKGRRRGRGTGGEEGEEGTGDGDRRRRGQRQAAGGEGGQGGEGALSKDTPISVMKKQKNVVVGQGGQKEAPLVMHIQKMGLSQSTAQAIAKRIGQYLKQRKIPIAEVVRRLEMLMEQEITLPDQASKDDKERASQTRKRYGSDFEKGRERVAQLEKELAAKKASNDVGKDQAARMIQQDLERAKKNLADLEQGLGAAKSSASEKSKERAKQKQATRSQVRDVGKDKGVVGKIVSRFVSDNQQLLRKDAALKATLEDPQKFNKMVKSIRNMLGRQLKRRGYDATQLKGLLEVVEPMLATLREQRS